MTALDTLLQQPPFSLPQAEKERVLLPALLELTRHHRQNCPAYRRILDVAHPEALQAACLADLPYLPISLFKHRSLRSVPDDQVRVTISSSGTTGTERSHVDLDAATARLSSRSLSLIIGHATGNRRLPMLIIDSEAAVRGRNAIGARASAILGLMPFGRNPCFALREDMSVDDDKIGAFLREASGQDILIYGFTSLIWQYFATRCGDAGHDMSRALLLHSGGWKKLVSEAVDPAAFKAKLRSVAGIERVMNFYGMAELPGTIFLENEDGLLYPPHFADIIIRDPVTFAPLPTGQAGLAQIISLSPQSYPGHSLLTEDLAVIESTDRGVAGRMGHGVRFLGRAPSAPLRGCSDVLAAAGGLT